MCKWNTPKGYCGNPFGPSDLDEYLPTMEEIPKEFSAYGSRSSKWNTVVSDWFFNGLTNCVWITKDGISTEDAVGHISTIMSSFEPKHEHKEAGCTYLLSLWFDDVSYTKEKCR